MEVTIPTEVSESLETIELNITQQLKEITQLMQQFTLQPIEEKYQKITHISPEKEEFIVDLNSDEEVYVEQDNPSISGIRASKYGPGLPPRLEFELQHIHCFRSSV